MRNLLILILFLTSQIWATDYYFSSSTGSDGGLGTQASPYATMDKLATIDLVAGDKIYFKRGDVWKPTSSQGRLGVIQLTNVNGTLINPIIFDAYGTGDLPLISDELNDDYGSTIRFFSSASYIYFRNLHIYGEIQWKIDKGTYGTTTGVHNLKFNDCYIEYGRFTTSNTIVGHPTTYNYVPNINDPYTNPIYKIEIGGCTLDNQGLYLGDDWVNFVYGIRYIDESGNPLTGSGLLKDSPAFLNRGKLNLTTGAMPDTNIWIHDNVMINSYDELLDIPGGNLHLIERNQFIGSRDYANIVKFHSGYSWFVDSIIRDNLVIGASYNVALGNGSTGGGFALISLGRCIIENNTASARFAATMGNMNRVGNGNSGSSWGSFKDNIIRNNNFYGAVTVRGIGFMSNWGWENDMLDSATYVNSFEGNNYYINQQYPESMVIRAYQDDRVGTISSKHIGTSGSYRGTFQDIWVNEFPTTNESNSNPQMTNPVWTDPYNPGDYTLANGSPLIDAGSATVPDHIYDINLNQRSQGTIDVGAYEFNGVDITSPRVTSATLLNETTLLVSFSEPLSSSNANNSNNYTISNGVSVSSASLTGNQVTLTTSAHSSGNFTVTVNNIQDLAGNVITSNNTASYTFNQDNEGPELVSAQINNATTVVVNFNEAVNQSSAEISSNYSINNGITISEAVLNSSTQVALTTSEHGTGTFTLSVSGVEDLAGNSISSGSSAEYSYNSDAIAPTLASATILNVTTVEVNFSEAVVETEAENVNNYFINNGIIVSAVVLTTPTKATLTTTEHASGSYTVTVVNVKDLAGNTISSSNNTANYSIQVDTTPPEVVSAEILGITSVKVTYSENVQKVSAETIANYAIDNGINVLAASLSPLGKEVTLTTSNHVSASYNLVVTNIKDLDGNTISANNTAQYTFNADNEAPSVVSVEILNENHVKISFSESINQGVAENSANYIINKGIIVNTVELLELGTEVLLTTSSHTTGTYTVTVNNVEDISGNVIGDNNSGEYNFNPDLVAPQMLYAIATDINIIEISFSEELSKNSAEDTQNYYLSDGAIANTAVLQSNGKTVNLTTSDLVVGHHYTLTVENLEDLSGNLISVDSKVTTFCFENKLTPLVLYDFTNGIDDNIVYDVSCNGTPLNLTIDNLSAVTWLDGGGLSINSSVSIVSETVAAKITNRCKIQNSVSVEAWLKPANTIQDGPARIVGLSNDPFNRNITLGQGVGTSNTYGYDVRLRTIQTTNNGFPSVTSPTLSVTTNLTHVVYTRSSNGQVKIFIDGIEKTSATIGGNLSNWDDTFKLILANEMSGDRPWLGELHKIAIYDYALNSEEVVQSYEEFNNTLLVNLKVILEGPYTGGLMSTDLLTNNAIPLEQSYSMEPWGYNGYEKVTEMPNDIVDWILVELRSDDTTVVAKRAAFLRKDGQVVDLNGVSKVSFKDIPSGNYYAVVHHRNHLSIMSSEKVLITNKSHLLDLTKESNISGDDTASDIGSGVFAMYAGDTNCSAIITFSDAMSIVQDNTITGYKISDVNLSGIVTFADVTSVVNNNTKATNVKLRK